MLRNDTAAPEETIAALDGLRILVEPIDLANGAPSCSGPAQPLAEQCTSMWLAQEQTLRARLVQCHSMAHQRAVRGCGSETCEGVGAQLPCVGWLKRADMGKLGGLEQLVRLLGPEQPPGVQAGAAHALGTAAANNAALQALLLSSHPDVFQRLVPVRLRCIACTMCSAHLNIHVLPEGSAQHLSREPTVQRIATAAADCGLCRPCGSRQGAVLCSGSGARL